MSLALVCAAVASASARREPMRPLIGANEIMKITTPTGFVDDVITYDATRVAYVVADGASKCELHVVKLGCTKCIEANEELVVDLSPITLRPILLELVGQRALVIGATEDGSQIGALVELGQKAATSVYRLGPAAHITVIARDGKRQIAVHKTVDSKTGTRQEIELLSLDTGKRVAKGRPFVLVGDHEKKLDFRVNHWGDGWTRAYGIKAGTWNKKTDQRSPNTEAAYDLLSGKFVEDMPIADLFEQRKRFEVLADMRGQLDFARIRWDNSEVRIWHRGRPRSVALDQPLTNYDPKSLLGALNPDGSALLALTVDPVNPDAVARKKADPEYLDVFQVASDGKATRKARVYAKGKRYRIGTIGNQIWLLERSTGFDRGGRSLTIYQLQ